MSSSSQIYDWADEVDAVELEDQDDEPAFPDDELDPEAD